MVSKDLSEIIEGLQPDTRLPYGVSRYYASLAASDDPYTDPVAAQFVPREEELRHHGYESADPLSDQLYTVLPRLVHHYPDRVLILVNDRCATYCRHCFRRHFTGSADGRITETELLSIENYIADNPRINEVLLSGGDPLMLGDREIVSIIQRLRKVGGRDVMIRLASRMPVVLPSRITEDLAIGLREAGEGSLWLVTHVNHPREVTPQFSRAVARLIDNGIPVLNQAVLLKGVNNELEVLESLFRSLINIRVKPYYLFQGDLAAGTSHFRTGLSEGLELMDGLRLRLSGLAIPTFAVDLPEGGGKIPLTKDRIRKVDDQWYYLQGNDGKLYRYPNED